MSTELCVKAQMQTPNHLSPNKHGIFILLLKLILVIHGIFLGGDLGTSEINVQILTIQATSAAIWLALLEVYNRRCKLVLFGEESGFVKMKKQATSVPTTPTASSVRPA
jgi:hypothetical protein